MTQRMQFTHSDYSISFSEINDNGNTEVQVRLVENNMVHSVTLMMGEIHLIELRKWINTQLRELNKIKVQ